VTASGSDMNRTRAVRVDGRHRGARPDEVLKGVDRAAARSPVERGLHGGGAGALQGGAHRQQRLDDVHSTGACGVVQGGGPLRISGVHVRPLLHDACDGRHVARSGQPRQRQRHGVSGEALVDRLDVPGRRVKRVLQLAVRTAHHKHMIEDRDALLVLLASPQLPG